MRNQKDMNFDGREPFALVQETTLDGARIMAERRQREIDRTESEKRQGALMTLESEVAKRDTIATRYYEVRKEWNKVGRAMMETAKGLQ